MNPSGSRIEIDPEDLRRVATRMRGAALLLSGAGRELAVSELPSMPPGLRALVTEVACRANAELQELATELVKEAATLTARATWAELGGGAEIAWLIPGLRSYPAGLSPPAGPAAPLPPVTDEQIRASSEWAMQLLDEMHDSIQLLDEQASELGDEVDDAFGSKVARFADEYADEIPVKALGKVTLLAGLALDVYEHRREGVPEAAARGGISLGMGAGGGALGVLACEAIFGITGVGLVGCLVAGGVAGGLAGDQLGDEVFEE